MEEHVAEKLRVIADTYRHWVELVEELELPGFEDCPLCRFSIMCAACPVMEYTGEECTHDEDFSAYVDRIVGKRAGDFTDENDAGSAGRIVQDKILSLWLAVLDGRMVEDWR